MRIAAFVFSIKSFVDSTDAFVNSINAFMDSFMDSFVDSTNHFPHKMKFCNSSRSCSLRVSLRGWA